MSMRGSSVGRSRSIASRHTSLGLNLCARATRDRLNPRSCRVCSAARRATLRARRRSLPGGVGGAHLPLGQVHAAHDGAEQVVEVVGDPARHGAQGLHLLQVAQALVEQAALGDVADEHVRALDAGGVAAREEQDVGPTPGAGSCARGGPPPGTCRPRGPRPAPRRGGRGRPHGPGRATAAAARSPRAAIPSGRPSARGSGDGCCPGGPRPPPRWGGCGAAPCSSPAPSPARHGPGRGPGRSARSDRAMRRARAETSRATAARPRSGARPRTRP